MDPMPMLNLVLALLAGVVTVAAPCTLPMLPILLGASVGQTGKARPAMIALGFVMSFSRGRAGCWARSPACSISIPTCCATGAAILLLGFGLLMIWPAPFEWLSIRLGGSRPAAPARHAIAKALIGGFVLGTTLGLVWTPCAGPVLGSILTVVATSKDTAWASAAAGRLRHRRSDPDAGDRLWRPGRHHPRPQHRAHRAETAAGLWRRRDRLRGRVLLPIRHADRGVADRHSTPTARSASDQPHNRRLP